MGSQLNKKKKLIRLLRPSMRLYFSFLVIFVLATLLFGDYVLAAAEAFVVIMIYTYSVISGKRRQREIFRYIDSVTLNLDSETKNTLLNMHLPMVIFNLKDGRVLWSNDSFLNLTGDREHLFEISITDMMPGLSLKWLAEGKDQSPDYIRISGRSFRVYGNVLRMNTKTGITNYLGIMYMVDMTEFILMKNEYSASRPIVSILMLDNYDDLFKNLNDTSKSSLLAALDMKINEWTSDTHGYVSKIDRDRYVYIFEERYMKGYVEEKFSLLDNIRKVSSPSGITPTVSIGIGKDASSLDEAFQFAKMSIEMALSRGGDQVVVKNKNNFEFYGGHAATVEKRTKVKARVMASALGELIGDASGIIVMGHKYADLDCIGPAAGICCIARKKGKTVRIVHNPKTNLAMSQVLKLSDLPEYEGVFVSPQDAILFADSKTLLIIIDTNRPEQVESESLLMSANRIAVIDHHRRASTYIANAALNFHEPYASSTSELVTELLQYLIETDDLLKVEAEALLSGIVLDSGNFGMRTGSKTFEAAALLRRAGADIAEVKKQFQSDFPSTVAKYKIIQNTKIYKDRIAISAIEEQQERVIAAKAADELLSIAGIEASFVLYKEDNAMNISARSDGSINVQLILEKLGGGGNPVMAGASIIDKTVEEIMIGLYEAIDMCVDE
ncbi:MAG: DHH family phosphoesterase [Clostridiales bacterium]|nr:DHH family phosphoesterase [Clostridiales bacterium]